eukprot:3796256-Amphidinium_carterae.1
MVRAMSTPGECLGLGRFIWELEAAAAAAYPSWAEGQRKTVARKLKHNPVPAFFLLECQNGHQWKKNKLQSDRGIPGV